MAKKKKSFGHMTVVEFMKTLKREQKARDKKLLKKRGY